MKRLFFEGGAVARDEEPMGDLASQEFNRTDGRELAEKLGIFGVRGVRKYQPNAVIPRRFGTIQEHANNEVAQVNC
jgi:hypothetical protein